MCKVYTKYHGTSEIDHSFVRLYGRYPSLKLGDFLSVRLTYKPCFISHLYHNPPIPNLSTRYSVMCKVYTEYHGTSEIDHSLCACTVDSPSLKLGDYLSVRLTYKPCFISHLYHNPPIPNLSTRYSVMCKVCNGYHGTSQTEHGLCACTVDNPLAKARGLSLRTGSQTMLYLSHEVYFGILSRKVVVALLFYVHGKHLRSCRDGQLT